MTFVGNDAIGKVSACVEHQQAGLHGGRFTSTLAAASSARIALAASACSKPYTRSSTQTNSHRHGNATAINSASVKAALGRPAETYIDRPKRDSRHSIASRFGYIRASRGRNSDLPSNPVSTR